MTRHWRCWRKGTEATRRGRCPASKTRPHPARHGRRARDKNVPRPAPHDRHRDRRAPRPTRHGARRRPCDRFARYIRKSEDRSTPRPASKSRVPSRPYLSVAKVQVNRHTASNVTRLHASTRPPLGLNAASNVVRSPVFRRHLALSLHAGRGSSSPPSPSHHQAAGALPHGVGSQRRHVQDAQAMPARLDESLRTQGTKGAREGLGHGGEHLRQGRLARLQLN